METIWKEDSNDSGIVGRISKLEKEIKLGEAKKITTEEKQPYPWKGKFKSIFKKNPKSLRDKVIVLCLNSKREIEEPLILPIISGGIIVYKDKGFQFDPSALYTIKLGNKINKVLVLEEDDRLPVGSRYKQLKSTDIEELKKQGRYTFNDSILLKMLWNAQIEKIPKGAPAGMIKWIIIAVIAIIIIYMFIGK